MTHPTPDPQPHCTEKVPGTFSVQCDAAPAGLRLAVLARTQRVQRRRRVVRRASFALAGALLFAAGFGSARLASSPTPGAERVENIAQVPAPERAIVPASSEPEELELAAEASATGQRQELLLRAGDAYLVERGDIERALRCYRRYLASSPAPQTAREESWLLTALRTQRL
ncbi:MAG: hypothetical protein JNM84_24685 [Planctomycetes bacterium]|nr:hypothetical protein [Planctomycetota bacterium]